MSLKNLSVKIPKLLENNLRNKRVNKIYKSFENSLNIKKSFAIAVSGGADSLALSFLAKIYSIKNDLEAKFFIIDHKLRNESTSEAKAVKKVLNKLDIKAEILTWNGKKPKNNIQSIARKKRYELLLSKCKKLKINNILFGHHQNDLFENFFIRILRGSGLKGLVSFNKRSKVNDINILRPLLDLKKKDLEFVSRHVFNYYVNDPSNQNNKFLRIRVRKLLFELEKEGLDNKKFFRTINNLQDTDNAIKFYVEKNLQENSFFSLKKKQLILNNNFFIQPHEVVLRSLSDLLRRVGESYYPVRGKKIEKIINEIEKKEHFKVTLGGCIIKKVNQTVIISKEY